MADVPVHRSEIVGYCTNVHAGATYREMLDNLTRYALRVKGWVSPDSPMGIGLWLSRQAAEQVIEGRHLDDLARWLDERGLCAFTLNGFPQHDFHRPVVKHDVYRPDWSDIERRDYTLHLITILERLTPAGGEAGISTLPVGWRAPFAKSATRIGHAAEHLVDVAHHLASVEEQTGKLIHLDIEPEPGCYLDTSVDMVRVFEEQLDRRGDPQRIRRYLRVCHDICHAAVMYEDQEEMLERYAQAGIAVGKVQVSSAIHVSWADKSPTDRREMLAQLGAFAEDRYLHQTVVRAADGTTRFFEDLPDALRSAEAGELDGVESWRIHFHVPLYLGSLGMLETTQQEIVRCLALLHEERGKGWGEVRQYEAETYAWNVLPRELQQDDLARGIADELIWLEAARREAGCCGAE